MADLYRQQAVEFCGTAQFGSVGLHRPLPANMVSTAILLLLVLLVSFVVLGTYTRKATVPGYLVPDKGILTSVAPTGGIISDIYVNEGDFVEAGEPLFRIKPQRFSLDNTDINKDIANKINEQRQNLVATLQQKSSYYDVEQSNLSEQLNNAQHERQYLKESIFYVESQINSQLKLVTKYRELYERDYVSELDFNSAQQKLLLLKERNANLRREAFQLENRLKALQQTKSNEEKFYHEATSQLKGQILALENQLLEAQSATEQTVIAEQDGTIGSVLHKVNQYVYQGNKVLTVLPKNAQLQARLLVPGESAGFLQAKQNVRLRMSAFPYQKYGVVTGTLIRISQDTIEPAAVAAPIKPVEAVYRVDVELNTSTHTQLTERLKPGMKLEADVLLDTRTLFQWITAPLKTFPS